MSLSDLFREASSGITRRTGRSVLTALGTVLGVGAVVATLGLTTTAGAQIGKRFDVLKATEVVVQDTDPSSLDGPGIPTDAEDRLSGLNGVRAAGELWTVRSDAAVTSLPGVDGGGARITATLSAVSPGALRAMDPVMDRGRLYDIIHDRRAEQVAVIGAGLANRLGISSIWAPGMSVAIDDRMFTVVGIVGDLARRPVTLTSIAVPPRTALGIWGHRGTETSEVLIETDLGAAQLIAQQAPVVLDPTDPERLIAIAPPDPATLRSGVESDFSALFLFLALVSLAIGAVSIANTTLVSVLERVPEIGLRRAIGASRKDVAIQFLAESAILGTIGGVVGACAGIVLVVVVSAFRQWGPVVEPWVALAAPWLGTLTGLAAGLYPSLKAARIEPVEALQR